MTTHLINIMIEIATISLLISRSSEENTPLTDFTAETEPLQDFTPQVISIQREVELALPGGQLRAA